MLISMFLRAGLSHGNSCNYSTCSEEPLKSGISAFLFWDCLLYYIFIVFTIWGNDLDCFVFQIWHLCIRLSTVSHCIIYVSLHITGQCLQKPRAWNLQALQVWFQSVIVTKDFMYSIYCLTFVSSHLCVKC